MERRLSAILVADVAGYSRLVGMDEAVTLRTVKHFLESVIQPKVEEYNGRVVKFLGDGVLAEFSSVVQAMQCAKEFQDTITKLNVDVPASERIEFRVGINLGDVVADEGDIYGDGVNVAARLEKIADTGGICVSRAVQRELAGKLDIAFEDLGQRELKNIAQPVRVYKALIDTSNTASSSLPPSTAGVNRTRLLLATFALLLVGIVAGFAIWQKPWTTGDETALSIAVLPFNTQAGGNAEDYFSDGLTEDVISALSRFPELTVLSRTAVFSYKRKGSSPEKIGEDLNVRYLVDGSVRKTTERLRVSVRLSDAVKGILLWSENFDEAVDDVFVLQDKVTHRVVGTLVGRLALVEEQRSFAKPTDNLEAYDLALRGRSYFHKGDRSANYKARELFEQAIERDPDFAAAHSWLARTHLNDAVFGWVQWPHKSLERSFKLVQKAISLDQTSGISHALLAEIYTYRQRYDLAEGEANRAISLNPSHADGHAILGLIMIRQGQIVEAIQSLETARRFNTKISPDWSNMLGVAYFLEQRNDDAVRLLEALRVQFPEFAYSHVVLGAVYGELGDATAARRAVLAARKLAPFFNASQFAEQYLHVRHRPRFLEALSKAGFE